ncbi:MAG: ABC transporter permease [Myxococcota bacterium]
MRELVIDTWRSIVAHRVRFGLTSLGIAWGAFMLTFLSSNLEGFSRHFVAEFEELGPRIVFMGPGSILKDRVGDRGARVVELEAEDADRAEQLVSVEEASPEIGRWALPVRQGRRSKLLRVSGLDAGSDIIRNFEMERGRYLSPLDVARGARVAVLGAEASERLFGRRDPIGGTILVDGLRYRVIGTLVAKGEQLMNSNDRDDLKVVIPYTTAQRWIARNDEVQQLILAPVTKEASWEAIRRVREIVALREGYDPSIETAMWAFNIQEPLQMIEGMFLGIRIFMLGAGLVTLFVGAIGVMNIMLVVVGERVQEIGVRKAVGATSREIFVQFLAEATAVSAVSGVTGAAAGIALVQGISLLLPEGTAYQSPPVLDPITTGAFTVALIGVGIVAGVVPAIRAAQTLPAEALRSF